MHERQFHSSTEGIAMGERGEESIPTQGSSADYSRAATYVEGAPTEPKVNFDNGFLDQFAPRSPTAGDYLEYAKWVAKLNAAETLRPDLVDATRAYRHFLDADGTDLQFSYEKYVGDDASGRTTLRNAMLSAQLGVITLWKALKKTSFSFTGTAITCGESSNMFPYPATENWQKAIGGHIIWLSGDVTVGSNFTAVVTLHAKDRYNFNPGQKDIATGTPDSANGIFEITGLGKQFDSKSTLKRKLVWTGETLGSATMSPTASR